MVATHVVTATAFAPLATLVAFACVRVLLLPPGAATPAAKRGVGPAGGPTVAAAAPWRPDQIGLSSTDLWCSTTSEYREDKNSLRRLYGECAPDFPRQLQSYTPTLA